MAGDGNVDCVQECPQCARSRRHQSYRVEVRRNEYTLCTGLRFYVPAGRTQNEWEEEETCDLEARQRTRTACAQTGDRSLAWIGTVDEGEIVQKGAASGGWQVGCPAPDSQTMHRSPLEMAQEQTEVRPCVSLLDCAGSGTSLLRSAVSCEGIARSRLAMLKLMRRNHVTYIPIRSASCCL